MRSFLNKLAALTMLIFFAASARAGAFDPHQVPADAHWVIHVDFDVLRTSKLWAMFQGPLMATPQYGQAVAMLKGMTGIQFPEGVHDITLYGKTSDPRDGVLLVHAEINHDIIQTLFVPATGNTIEHVGDRDIYVWKKGGQDVYGAFYQDDLAVVAHSDIGLMDALATMDGKNPPLEADSALSAGATPGILVYLSGRDFSMLGGENVGILKHVTSGWLTLGENGDQLVTRASITADDVATANQLEASIQGIKAMVALSTSGQNLDADQKQAMDALNNMTCELQDKTITLELPVPLDLFARNLQNTFDFQVKPDHSISLITHDSSASATQPSN